MIKLGDDWTIFLDRDGTLNKHIEGLYISDIKDFEFLPGVIECIPYLNRLFSYTIIVTNQQGIGKNLMTHGQLKEVHDYMLIQINENGGRIDEIYYCPDLEIHDPPFRKPRPGMALQAQMDFPSIHFRKSIMVGDQLTDMQFGKQLAMKTVFIGNINQISSSEQRQLIDHHYNSLYEFTEAIFEYNSN